LLTPRENLESGHMKLTYFQVNEVEWCEIIPSNFSPFNIFMFLSQEVKT